MTVGETIAGEEAIIDLLRPLASGQGALGLVDDCAVLSPAPGMDLVLKTDPIAEGVHFRTEDAPEDIAWKALAVNVSDLAAKAARPLGYLMALSFPSAPRRDWLMRFAAGLKVAQAAFGCTLLGGDTDRRPGPITISITVLGEVPAGRMVQRATALTEDRLFVSGTIGDAHLGLRLCQEPSLAKTWALTAAETASLQRRYLRPQPRLGLGGALRGQAHAAMDLSDGLVKDLARMARASGVSARITLDAVPLSTAARKAVAAEPGLLARLITAGDDYEVLAAVPRGACEPFIAEALAGGVPVTEIGTMRDAGRALVSVLDTAGSPMQLVTQGWDHF